MSKGTPNWWKVILCLLIGVLCVWLVLDVFPGHLSRRIDYRKAKSLIRARDFEKAERQIGQLRGISEYDKDYLRMYCRCYPLYLEGKIQEAGQQYNSAYHDWLYRDKMTVWDQPWLDWQAVSEIKAEADRRKREEEKREEAERQARAEQREKEYQEKVRSSEMPFLGMREEDVGKTMLGWYTGDVRRAQESYWYYDRSGLYRDPHRVGKREVTHYDFVRNGELVLEVFCTDGTVDELVRYEDGMFYYTWTYLLPEELTGDKKYRTTWNPKGYVATTKKSTRKVTARPAQDQKDYANEEDFYEDYADEFEDLDEAMDYYLDHYQ